MARKPRLTRERWIAAALEALGEGGLAAVAVEPLASRLGVTKGSFYWHFHSRDELLASALEEWERERTEQLIEQLDEITDPSERLAEWASHAFGADKALLLALHADAGHPLVAPVIRRVTERRVAWLAGLFRDAGVPAAAARRRAQLLYSADLGLFQVAEGTPRKRERAALAREVAELFLR